MGESAVVPFGVREPREHAMHPIYAPQIIARVVSTATLPVGEAEASLRVGSGGARPAQMYDRGQVLPL